MGAERPRLPRGRHRLSPEEVAGDQRRRLLDAAAEVFAERGARGTTSRRIAQRAGVSSSTFYAHYAGIEEILAANFALAAGSLLECVEDACEREPGVKVEAAVEAALALLMSAPARAAFLGPEAVIAVAASTAEWDRLTTELGGLMALASSAGSGRSQPGVERWLAAAALATASAAVAEPDGAGDLAAELASVITEA
jgi:AcrR family transcriptional regulator